MYVLWKNKNKWKTLNNRCVNTIYKKYNLKNTIDEYYKLIY